MTVLVYFINFVGNLTKNLGKYIDNRESNLVFLKGFILVNI
jgi:hypothetical protein